MPLNTSLNTPYLVLTGVVLIAIVFVFAVTQPQLDGVSQLRRDITQNQAILTSKQDFLHSLSVKLQQLQAQPEAERQLAVVVPQGDMTQDIVRVVAQYASATGMTVTGITNNSVERQAQLDASVARGDVQAPASDVRTLSFQLEMTGAYPQMRDFLKALEKSPRIIDISHVSLKQVAEQPGQITAALDIQAYSQSQ